MTLLSTFLTHLPPPTTYVVVTHCCVTYLWRTVLAFQALCCDIYELEKKSFVSVKVNFLGFPILCVTSFVNGPISQKTFKILFTIKGKTWLEEKKNPVYRQGFPNTIWSQSTTYQESSLFYHLQSYSESNLQWKLTVFYWQLLGIPWVQAHLRLRYTVLNLASRDKPRVLVRPYSHEKFLHTILRYCDKKIFWFLSIRYVVFL